MLFSHPPICSYMRVANVCSLTIHIGIEMVIVAFFLVWVSIFHLMRICRFSSLLPLLIQLNVFIWYLKAKQKWNSKVLDSCVFDHTNMRDQLIYVPSFPLLMMIDSIDVDMQFSFVSMIVKMNYYLTAKTKSSFLQYDIYETHTHKEKKLITRFHSFVFYW